MTLDAKMRAVAERLINKFGTSAQHVEITSGDYDPTTGQVPQTERIVKLKVSPPFPYNQVYRGASTAGRDALVCFLDAISAEAENYAPKKGDELIIAGQKFRCDEANPIMSGELIAAWELIQNNG